MKNTIKIAMAAALLAGATSFAAAQMSSGTSGAMSGSTQNNAAASGGSGTHQSGGPKTGSASNTQKVMKNQNGYQGQQ